MPDIAPQAQGIGSSANGSSSPSPIAPASPAPAQAPASAAYAQPSESGGMPNTGSLAAFASAIRPAASSAASALAEKSPKQGAMAKLKSLFSRSKKTLPKKAAPAMPSAAPSSAAEPQAKPKKKGNLFTRLFRKKEHTQQSIVDAIITQQNQAKKEQPKTSLFSATPSQPKPAGRLWLTFSRAFFHFTLLFIIASAGFMYTQVIDKENGLMDLVGMGENYASRLHASAQKLDDLKKQELELGAESRRYQEGYNDEDEARLQKIIDNRLDWNDLIGKVNEVVEFIYPLNSFFGYVELNNFSVDAKTGQVALTGSLSDPGQMNLTRLADLEDAFRYYPGEKDDPTGPRPYFKDFQGFTTYSKSYDSVIDRYTSRFSLSLKLNNDPVPVSQ